MICQAFFADWLGLSGLDNLRPNAEKFPGWRPELAKDMRAESLSFFRDVVLDQGRPLADILNAQVTYLTPRLARHYKMPFDLPGAEDAIQRVELNDVPHRGGLLPVRLCQHGPLHCPGGQLHARRGQEGLPQPHRVL